MSYQPQMGAMARCTAGQVARGVFWMIWNCRPKERPMTFNGFTTGLLHLHPGARECTRLFSSRALC
jgi:hypothetical protein